MKKRIIIGISGASGTVLAVRLLEAFKQINEWETHVVISDSAIKTMLIETEYTLDNIMGLADVSYDNRDVGASIASGSFITSGMIIVPCSMKTLAGISSGYSENLILRAADVVLKERRKLLLIARETPLNQIHLKNMSELTSCGAVIMPPVMTFYNKPYSIDDMINHMCGKILDVFGVDFQLYKRWKQQ